MTVNLSTNLKVTDAASKCVNGLNATTLNAVDTFGKLFHASHAKCFPLLKKAEVVSQPVKL